MEEALTQAVWDFMAGAHRKGLLDELLALSGGLLGPEVDLEETLGGLEDTLSAADFASFERMSEETLLPALQALSQEEVLEGLLVLITSIRPFVDRAVEGAGGDPRVLKHALDDLRKNLLALKTVVMAILPVLKKVYGPSVELFLREKAGDKAAGAVNTACTAIERNPDAVNRFVSDLFAGVDGRTFRKASDIVLGAVLDQRPPVVGWAVSTAANRVRNRLFSGRGGR